MKLRSIELVLPNASSAANFLVNIWGLANAGSRDGIFYLRGAAGHPYLVSLEEGVEPAVRSTTFVCDAHELTALASRIGASSCKASLAHSADLGGGKGLLVELPEGEIFRFLAGATEVADIEGRDLPVQLTHVVFNSVDAECTATAAEKVLGFRVSDRTKGMVFVRCNDSHHSTAFARAGFSSLNHIAFEMRDIDAVMRGIGRLRDHGMSPSWGPGRHGPGDNVFAYFIAPFGAVVEFSTAVDKVPDTHRAGAPADWTWPANRIDQWGMSGKDLEQLGIAERRFRFRRDWDPVNTQAASGVVE